MVVFDTSIIIDVLRQRKSALDLLASYSKKETIAITAISKYEILRGTKERNLNLVSQLFTQFVIYDFDDSSIEEAAKAYKKLKDKGKMTNELDLLIEGIATANNETLITKDRDFLNFENPRIIIL
jgi:predicted nucleic acid-binding protein